MSVALCSLIGYVAWALLLASSIGTWRVTQVLLGEKKSNEFPSGTPHGGERYWRLNRAHLNTVENLPIVAAIVLTGTVLHVDTPMWRMLPAVALAARVVQSTVHISSGSVAAVNLRFTAFLTQLVCFAWMIVEILRVRT
jgi:hypothetical protein